MHLTNYSVNKRNKSNYDEGDENGERGSKRSLAFLFEHLRRNNKDADLVWKNIQVNILNLPSILLFFLTILKVVIIYTKYL